MLMPHFKEVTAGNKMSSSIFKKKLFVRKILKVWYSGKKITFVCKESHKKDEERCILTFDLYCFIPGYADKIISTELLNGNVYVNYVESIYGIKSTKRCMVTADKVYQVGEKRVLELLNKDSNRGYKTIQVIGGCVNGRE